MSDQTSASLKIIEVANQCFGTIRFSEICEATDYRYNLGFEPQQLPSIYYGDDPQQSNRSVRLRPFHDDGFCAVQAETRMYLAIAGLTDEIVNPRNALTADLKQVNGPIYQSKYYVFVRLGVNRDTIQETLNQLSQVACPVTSDALAKLNAERTKSDQTKVLYVTDGALSGTYWAQAQSGWTDTLNAPQNGLYRPLDLIDFEIENDEVDLARDKDMKKSLQLLPVSDQTVHFGHALIDPGGLQDYYGSQSYPDGTGGSTSGNTIWQYLPRLGSFKQSFGLMSNGFASVVAEILPGAQIYPRAMFELFPELAFQPDTEDLKTRQRIAICNMIARFVNN